jgi:16S rRNA (cytidine1402-2'-O)-methyltransferase
MELISSLRGVSRIEKSISDLTEIMSESDFVICRELTKKHQTVHRFKGSEFKEEVKSLTAKGEFTCLVHNDKPTSSTDGALTTLANQIVEEGIHPKKVAELLSKLTSFSKKEIYNKLLKDKKK